ncbi:MAG TPA: DUF1697 domain-containing protein [Pseudonocardiaceae bacterium]|jgi:uncharacterized protein (DUF1697 family)|nr:DUF1697 domain-containing protein [Pseudonocardiaceae bacterium]
MARYAVLLRGINVGGHAKIPMADLRELLAGLGHTEVRTLLQSGNAVFTAAKGAPERLAARIEKAADEAWELNVRCLIRTAAELDAVIDAHPLAEVATNGSRMMALFLSANPDPKLLAAHDPVTLAPEQVRVGDRVIYQWCPDGVMAAPPVGPFVERHLKVAVTARNWNTVTKLAVLLKS